MVGLLAADVEERRRLYGLNAVSESSTKPAFNLLVRQFTNPTVVILSITSVIYGLLGNFHDAVLILFLIIASCLLTFTQEFRAELTLKQLASRLKVFVTVIRDNQEQRIPIELIVPGDLVSLTSGDFIPADLKVVHGENLSIDESILTGESFPKHKDLGMDMELEMGTYLVSGSCIGEVTRTGKNTKLGKLVQKLATKDIETTFEVGIRKFGNLVARAIIFLVIFVLIGNLILNRPLLSSVLFSLALAIGLTPQMLPVIISVCLSVGARQLAQRKVLIRRLDVIEDLGTMEVLCTDKTGTLTTGKLEVAKSVDPFGNPSTRVLTLAYENASLQESSNNSIDKAILRANSPKPSRKKVKEFNFSFSRRIISVLLDDGVLISKGAVREILDCCTNIQINNSIVQISNYKLELQDRSEEYAAQGYKVIAVASGISNQESGLTFEGFILIEDPAKIDAPDSLSKLKQLGVDLVLITGDSRASAVHIAKKVAIPHEKTLIGSEIDLLDNSSLLDKLRDCFIFAEIDPIQKSRIVQAIRDSGKTVGFLGDGINDSLALKMSDVSISVDSAVEIAKSASSVVLLEKDLSVIADGIKLGRRTFENTMKYVKITISASFGNVLSMAIASFFLPFLPMLPTQILLLNFLSDLPALAISWDKVDEEDLARPSQWQMKNLGHFMIIFGLASTIFDLLLFLIGISILNGSESEVRSSWFAASLITEIAAILILRTRRKSWQSKPSRYLIAISLFVLLISWLVPALGIFYFFGLPSTPGTFLLVVFLITTSYALTLEILKQKIKVKPI